MNREDRVGKLYEMMHGTCCLIEMHPDDAHYQDNSLIGEKFILMHLYHEWENGWCSGQFLLKYSRVKNRTMTRYFYRAKFKQLTAPEGGNDAEGGEGIFRHDA